MSRLVALSYSPLFREIRRIPKNPRDARRIEKVPPVSSSNVLATSYSNDYFYLSVCWKKMDSPLNLVKKKEKGTMN